MEITGEQLIPLPHAEVGSRLIDGVARKMADDFFTAFNEKLAPTVKAAGAAGPATGKRRIHPAWWVAGALLLVFLVYLALLPAHWPRVIRSPSPWRSRIP